MPRHGGGDERVGEDEGEGAFFLAHSGTVQMGGIKIICREIYNRVYDRVHATIGRLTSYDASRGYGC